MCVFCKIVSGEIPSYKIYEDDNFLAFLDISQATIGHTLVIPKKHFTNIFELDNSTANKIYECVVNVSNKLKNALDFEGFNIINNNGELAGQTVFHYHIHLIPRYKNDNLNISFSRNDFSKEQLINLAEKINNS